MYDIFLVQKEILRIFFCIEVNHSHHEVASHLVHTREWRTQWKFIPSACDSLELLRKEHLPAPNICNLRSPPGCLWLKVESKILHKSELTLTSLEASGFITVIRTTFKNTRLSL